ncbi:hypothetical protein [Pontibacter vulgaris]|uniref:hypothetical protein n=1 Tax=Pontibacter vulgaris TaxID=2905679 RepID=UPI001FA760E5|nr:hypothetical protein [Pontibacter vulgaris]
MRHENVNYRDNREEREPRWLHEQEHGHNSSRGNYTTDSHFNLGYGRAYDKDYGDQRNFNANAEQSSMYPEGRYQSGGATYSGEDFSSHRRPRRNNPLGVVYTDDRYNSGRHYDARADYRNTDYEHLRHNAHPSERYRMADERFGHDVVHPRNRKDDLYLGHSSRGDFESYRRYEEGNPRYDSDYRGGFAGRNYSDQGRPHFGEDTSYGNQDRWQNQQQGRNERGPRNR